MKRILNQISCLFLIGIVAISSCKEDEGLKPADSLTTKEFTYNLATKKFAPEVELNGNLNSPSGIKLVYYYVLRNGKSPQLVHTEAPALESQNDYSFTLPNSAFADLDMTDATGLKVMVRHLDNTSFEGLVKIVPFTPEKPALSEFPASVTPDLAGGTTLITGKVTAESGLAKIEIFDDFNGEFVLVQTITGLNDATSFSLNYNYPFRKRASQVKIVATDLIGVPAETIVKLDVEYLTKEYKNISLVGQSNTSSTAGSFFNVETGAVLSSCDAWNNINKIDFMFYITSVGVMNFYSPVNSSGVQKNYKCQGAQWVPASQADFKATQMKVLVPSTASDIIYQKYAQGTIEKLDDSFFAGISAPTTASNIKYDAVTSNTTTFNTTTASLIWVRIPQGDGSYKNGLMKIKAVTLNSATVGLSTIEFDFIAQK